MTVDQIAFHLAENQIGPVEIELLQNDSRTGVRKCVERFLARRQADSREQKRLHALFAYESEARCSGYTYIAGIDEVGRGPLAGPVVAAAVILPEDAYIKGINDSKLLSAQKREQLYSIIIEKAVAWSVGVGEVVEIDTVNILNANKMAMMRAVDSLAVQPDFVLVDALKLDGLHCPQRAIISGDRLSASIAAASIVAKVTRDRWMREMDKVFGGYGFAQNKGYATAEHLAALQKLGACPMHRKSFLHLTERKMGSTGQLGEEQAAAYLCGLGYEVIARNWRCERGEIDIIARDGGTLVFVEVKTRRSDRFGPPTEAVDTRKQERLRLLALSYIHTTGHSAAAYRFDVASVDLRLGTIEIFKDAF
jgi:ribonuclease HII